MKTCKAIIFQQSGIRRCPNPAKTGKHFCPKHRHYLWVVIVSPIFLFVLGYLGTKLFDKVFDSSDFPINIHVVDWNNRTNNEEIYNKGGIIYFNGKEVNELTTTNNGNFTFDLPASFNKDSVRVHFKPKLEYNFMKLDTIIRISKNSSTYRLKMYFKGINEITGCKLIDDVTQQPIENAIVEINGVADTTKTDGKFTIKLLLPEQQERIQTLTIKKDGYEDYIDNNFDMTAQSSYLSVNLIQK